jgi:hypothetical protein
VRNGRSQSTDPVGGQMLPDYVEVRAPTRTSIRSTWMATGAITVIAVMTAAVAWGLLVAHRRPAPSPEVGYLLALRDDGLFNQFNSEANAVAHGRQVCRQLDQGGPQEGQLADKLAVDAFCPQFTEGFRILETATVAGSFILTDSAGAGAIAVEGQACKGADGYSDVSHSTPVTITNGKGETLTVTSLGFGKGDAANCTFSFSFPITEGQDRYVISVGHRGQFSYTFDQLRAHGVQIRLGH